MICIIVAIDGASSPPGGVAAARASSQHPHRGRLGGAREEGTRSRTVGVPVPQREIAPEAFCCCRGQQRGQTESCSLRHRRCGSEARWQAGRESRQRGTGQGKGGWYCGARSEREAGGTAGSTYPWWGTQCSDPWPEKLSLLPSARGPSSWRRRRLGGAPAWFQQEARTACSAHDGRQHRSDSCD
eukprot:1104412-Rhodomonas_salina.1